MAILCVFRQGDSECAFTKNSILKHHQISLSDANSIISFGVQFNALQILPTVSTVIFSFLVILEMMKMGQIDIVQENIFDDIMITAREQQNGQE